MSRSNYVNYLYGDYEKSSQDIHAEMKSEVLFRLDHIRSLIENEKYKDVYNLCFESVAGDYTGSEDRCIDFEFLIRGVEEKDQRGLGDIVRILEKLKTGKDL